MFRSVVRGGGLVIGTPAQRRGRGVLGQCAAWVEENQEGGSASDAPLASRVYVCVCVCVRATC